MMPVVRDGVRTFLGHAFRLFPLRAETGLRIFGSPDENSPVFVTANYDLTVKRVAKYLKQMDCYLLVAQSGGVNVWCAAAAEAFTEHSVISVIETSRIANRVKHRRLILPALSAPGINTGAIEKETGWHCQFGPVYAKDIPEYVRSGFKKIEAMQRVKYDILDRFDIALGCTLPFYFLILAFLLIFKRDWLFEFHAVSFPLFFIMHGFQPYLPSKYGWGKILSLEVAIAAAFLIYLLSSWGGSPYVNGLFIWAVIVTFLMGIDFAGFSPNMKGEADEVLIRLGVRKLWIFALKGTEKGAFMVGEKRIRLDPTKCIGCGLCFEICPMGLYSKDNDQKACSIDVSRCTACKACVSQCATGAISLVASG
jgi:NAD-dependent dihydropyrimidine dehydrogenase PreA subunit